MVEAQPHNPPFPAGGRALRLFIAREWLYLLIIFLAVLGIAYTSVSNAPITTYWMILAPLIGVVCVLTRWRDTESREARLRLIWTQALHWGAVLAAMRLIFVADVSQMMNADARALATLTLLALATFTAGIHVGAWRLCLVGIVLGAGVPAVAWLEQSALLLVLIVVVVVALLMLFFWPDARAFTPPVRVTSR